jgi:hypothetical protein
MLRRVALALVLVLAAAPAFAQGAVCRVADPTGTPLNVRTAPETGLVVSNLSNGTRVRVLQEVTDERGRRWAFVGEAGGERRTIGWVFRSFLRCD